MLFALKVYYISKTPVSETLQAMERNPDWQAQ